MSAPQSEPEIERICRVADMMCTGHALMRDRYSRLALVLDLLILGVSTWLVALTFVEPRINIRLTPFDFDPQIWIGFLGIGTFFLSVMQLYVSWKEKAGAHERALHTYSEIKREAKYILASNDRSEDALRSLVDRNTAASAASIGVSDSRFMHIKKIYKTKVEISRYLDAHPSASITLLRMKLWWRDNISPGGRP